MTIRFLRVLWMFGTIYVSYMLQFGLVRVFRRRGQRMPRWLKARREGLDERNARRLLRGMLRLRGVFIKLGQVLSILGGFLPRAFTRELESLQDNVPPSRSITWSAPSWPRTASGPTSASRRSRACPSRRRPSDRCTPR
jgi:predicted unusual protein kinase regulating ubiquinone biosynthesis (AarF/ABC1/UbiB family)